MLHFILDAGTPTKSSESQISYETFLKFELILTLLNGILRVAHTFLRNYFEDKTNELIYVIIFSNIFF